MYVETIHYCPKCKSTEILRNGHPHKNIQQWKCKSCNRYFSYTTAHKFPPTIIPFPVIAFILYMRKKMKMQRFYNYVNTLLYLLAIRRNKNLHHKNLSQKYDNWMKKHNGVTRQTIYNWIRAYDKDLKKIISFQDASLYIKNLLTEIYTNENSDCIPSNIPYQKVVKKKYKREKYMDILKTVQNSLGGQNATIEVIQNANIIFHELLKECNSYEVLEIQEIYE